MEEIIIRQLHQLNYEFYQNFAEAFSATRKRLQVGVMQILDILPPYADVLDIGCGNGELAAELVAQNFQGSYKGIDFSDGLLSHSPDMMPQQYSFEVGDLMQDDWDANLPSGKYDFVLAFAVLHHIPGMETRKKIIHKVHRLLKNDGRFVLSNWQFLNSPRLAARVQPWDKLNLTSDDLEENDYLMDWRRGGRGLRYVHHFTSSELHALARQTGFRISGIFTSDGEEGNLGLYHIWEKI